MPKNADERNNQDNINLSLPVHQFLESASTALLLLNDEGVIIASNQECINIFPGLKIKSIIFDYLIVEEADEVKTSLNNQTECFFASVHLSDKYLLEIVFRLMPNGSKCYYLGTVIRKLKTEPLSLIQQLIDIIPDHIFVKDIHSKFTLANTWVAKNSGVNSTEEVIGKTDFDFFPKRLAQKYYNDEQKVISTGEPLINEHEKVLINGRIRWYSTTKIPIYDDHGHITGIVGIGRDITKSVKERKDLEKAKKEAEKADQLKSTFLANLSHEIRTPLNGILGFSQFLKQKKHSEEKQNKYLDIILSNGKNLLMLINDIIDISMIESNQLSIKKRKFNLNELLDNIKTGFDYQIKQKNKSIRLTVHKELKDGDDEFLSDDFRISQILSNLISNSLKFTESGEIQFGYKHINHNLEFFVSDTGIGIDKEQQKDIFKRFRQVDESMTRRYGGTGLGLSICRGLVQLLKGQIWVKSESGRGATFYFTIPTEYSVNEPVKQEEQKIRKF